MLLSNKGLKCDIQEIKKLKYLKIVDLSFNYINSDIQIFKEINNITELNLAYNYFYGNINELNIKNVSNLNLKYNKLHGNVDLFTVNHNNLKIFDIGYNYFGKQSIPKFNKDIEYINIARNNFYGDLDNILDYSKLKIFDISFNNFDIHSPVNVSSLKNLNVINVRYNNFRKLFIMSNKVKYYDTAYNTIDDNLKNLNVLNESYIDISNNIINIVFNNSLKEIIDKNYVKLNNNIFRCGNNSKYYPYWVYNYYPNINYCQDYDNTMFNIQIKKYYVEFIVILASFVMYICITGLLFIYCHNKFKQKKIENYEKQTLISD